MNPLLYCGGVINLETVKEFQEVIESEFNVILDEKEAKGILLNWVGYFDLLSRIDHRRDNQEVGSRQ